MIINILLNTIILFVIVCNIYGFPTLQDVSLKKRKPDENRNLFEGDMRFPKTSPLVRGVLRRGDSVAWTDGIVPYEISSEYEPHERAFIVDIMQKMERSIAINNVKCIQFRPRIPSDEYYITIKDGVEDDDEDGTCSSFVGQNTGTDMERTVTLSIPQCLSQGLIMHELLHVLGFYHEQSRPDRDNYVKILPSNIELGMEYNFEKYDNSYVNTQNTPYDYSSIMHYDSYAFSSNNYPTIEPLDENVVIGQRLNMSPIDIEEVRLFYNCPSNGITLPTIPPIIKVNTTISSSLTTSSSTYDRTVTTGNSYYYESYEVYASSDGYYTFISNSSIDTYGYLYKEDFDPNDQYKNLMEIDDEAGGLSQFQLISYLESNTRYILVVTTYYPLVTGNYQLIVSESPSVNIGKLNNTSIQSTTITPLITTSSNQFLSKYSGALTINSLTFTRYGAYGIYYFEAIIISVSTNGLYTFESDSTTDSYGYLYEDNFDPFDPVENLLYYDDDGAENSQFLVTYSLKSNERYILIQTTFDEDDEIGLFSITASGPGTVHFNRMSNSAA